MWKSVIRPIDFCIAALLWLASIGLRASLGYDYAPDYGDYFKYSVALALVTSISFTRHGLYGAFQFRSTFSEIFTTIRANLFAILAFIMFGYFFAPTRVSRGTLLIYGGLSTWVFLVERVGLRTYLKKARLNERNRRHVVLVGNGEPLRSYIGKAKEQPGLGVHVVGWLDAPDWAAEFKIPTFSSLGSVPERNAVDAVVVSYLSSQSTRVDEFLKENYNNLLRIFVLPDLRSYAYLGVHLEDFSGLPVLALNQPSWSATDLMVKRGIDIIGAGIGLILLSPLLFLIAIGVKLTSCGPIFFAQERMGLDGKTFKMWKFRTMKPGDSKPGWTTKDDPRRTKFGSFLRATSIDELPQLWNVLIGDMSLVGPRPEQPYYVQNFRNEIPAYMLRHKMKAGITGWAQINGWRGDTSLHKRIECDLFYIRNWSVSLDLKILFLTVWRGFVHPNAY